MTKWISSSGKPLIDNRNWKIYNEELVRHGEFLLDYEWITKNWKIELEKMNKEKVGRKFQFPESLIKLQAVWHQLIDYREIEGITRVVVATAQLPGFNDYSTINRRVNKLEVDFQLPKQKFVSIATDGTGMLLNNSGEYLRDKHGNKSRKKWIRVTISANPLTKELLACDVSLEGNGLSEPQSAKQHIQNLIKHGKIINKFWGDGAFYVKELFNLLELHKIESAIKIHKNARSESRGSMRKAREVREYKSKGYEKWARDKDYGTRWLGTEVKFSAIKRKFGEKIRSRKIKNALKEAKRRIWAYEEIRRYAKA